MSSDTATRRAARRPRTQDAVSHPWLTLAALGALACLANWLAVRARRRPPGGRSPPPEQLQNWEGEGGLVHPTPPIAASEPQPSQPGPPSLH